MLEWTDRYTPVALAALRAVTGAMFLAHGVQKFFAWPLSAYAHGPVPLFSVMGFGGALELAGGLLIVLGLYTRPVAFILAGEMAVAYWMFHFSPNAPNGWAPIANGGESAIQYCFVFLLLACAGAGAWSLDSAMLLRSAK